MTPKAVASSQGTMRERWLASIYKEIENFLHNLAIEDVTRSVLESDGSLQLRAGCFS